MLFDIFDLPGETYGAMMQGTGTRPCRRRLLGRGPRALDQPVTGIVYPSIGRSPLTARSYVVTPLIADQEFHEPPPFETYWEGTCSVATRPARSSVRRTWS